MDGDLVTVEEIETRLCVLKRERTELQTQLALRKQTEWLKTRPGRDWRRRAVARLQAVEAELTALKSTRREALRRAACAKADVLDPDDAFGLLQASLDVIASLAGRLGYQLTEREEGVKDAIALFLRRHAPVGVPEFDELEAIEERGEDRSR